MPSMKFSVAADTSDALANMKFRMIPAGGAYLNLWAKSTTATDHFGLSIGSREIMTADTLANLEDALRVDAVDVNLDQIVFNELVEPGQLYMPVVRTTEMHFLIALRYLVPQ